MLLYAVFSGGGVRTHVQVGVWNGRRIVSLAKEFKDKNFFLMSNTMPPKTHRTQNHIEIKG
jgi:hypothetical protein